MCERGLVERIHDPTDRRKALVGLTDKGRRMREDIDKAWRQVHGDMFSVFPNGERVRFKELLTKFRDINIKRLR
jgi:DNA-binding MarR family transcriptional regulator